MIKILRVSWTTKKTKSGFSNKVGVKKRELLDPTGDFRPPDLLLSPVNKILATPLLLTAAKYMLYCTPCQHYAGAVWPRELRKLCCCTGNRSPDLSCEQQRICLIGLCSTVSEILPYMQSICDCLTLRSPSVSISHAGFPKYMHAIFPKIWELEKF